VILTLSYSSLCGTCLGICRLLNPEQDSSSALFVGNLVTQLIMQLSVRMAPHIRDLIAALVIRMQSTTVAVFKTTLLIVFARLVETRHLSLVFIPCCTIFIGIVMV
jgi:hypothetical protein